MSKLKFDITMSLDGLRSFQERHGRGGGETNRDDEIAEEALANTGAVIMGRRMFGGGPGPWDESWEGWWGDEPPFGVPVFVLTHHAREPLAMKGGTTFTFVTEGIESALEEARAAAGGKDVAIAGGGRVVQQYLHAGLADEFQVHVAPVLLGDGVRLFDQPGSGQIELEIVRVVESEAVTHLKYRVVPS
jgi:dihydrofolate reductase